MTEPVRASAPPAAPAPPVVAYSGEPGAFAEDAVRAYFGEETSTLPVGGFRGVFEAVAGGRAGAGVIPIENVVNGTVRENYDLLLEHDLTEGRVRDLRLDGLKRVYDDSSWLLIRASATESAIRIFAEAPRADRAEALVREGERVLLEALKRVAR